MLIKRPTHTLHALFDPYREQRELCTVPLFAGPQLPGRVVGRLVVERGLLWIKVDLQRFVTRYRCARVRGRRGGRGWQWDRLSDAHAQRCVVGVFRIGPQASVQSSFSQHDGS